jgi:hypothetical protein
MSSPSAKFVELPISMEKLQFSQIPHLHYEHLVSVEDLGISIGFQDVEEQP